MAKSRLTLVSLHRDVIIETKMDVDVMSKSTIYNTHERKNVDVIRCRELVTNTILEFDVYDDLIDSELRVSVIECID